MISVVIPTLNAETRLGETLSSLVPAAVDGLVREVIVADGGSADRTLAIADDAGAEIVKADGGRGAQLKAGAARARFPWLLFLEAGTYLDAGWEREAHLHIERVESGRRRARAASFRFEALVALRTRLLKLPSGDQGLLVPRALYDEVGGFGPLPLLEDMDLLRRIGRRRVHLLNARAVTNGERYRRDGYVSHMARSQLHLALYLLGVPVPTIAGLFRAPPEPVGEPAVGRSLR
jgi:glycosyltransferase involved in cell wall biosynthesis